MDVLLEIEKMTNKEVIIPVGGIGGPRFVQKTLDELSSAAVCDKCGQALPKQGADLKCLGADFAKALYLATPGAFVTGFLREYKRLCPQQFYDALGREGRFTRRPALKQPLVPPGVRVGEAFVKGDSGKRYKVTAWSIDENKPCVFMCSCPAFRYSTGDLRAGERKWCKHIKRIDRYALANGLPQPAGDEFVEP